MKTLTPRFLRTSALALVAALAGPFCLDAARANQDETAETQSPPAGVIEGVVIKVKTGKNEIYFRSAQGRREEIYLDRAVQITQGANSLKIEDLKKDMKVRVTGRNKVEVLN